MTVTRSGRHAAGRPPSRALPVVGAAFLLALAAGGWSLFAQTPSEAEQLALAGEQNALALPPALRTVTAIPVSPERGVRRPSRTAGPGYRPHEIPEAEEELTSHPMITPPEVPTVVVPTATPPRSEAEVPELQPKTTTVEKLGHLTDSAAEGLASELRSAEAKVRELKATDLNWDAVARCASRNDPRAVTPGGEHGLYHFTLENWRSVGGAGLPSEATSAEQTRRAQLLYAREGGRWESLWPQCGRLLFLK